LGGVVAVVGVHQRFGDKLYHNLAQVIFMKFIKSIGVLIKLKGITVNS